MTTDMITPTLLREISTEAQAAKKREHDAKEAEKKRQFDSLVAKEYVGLREQILGIMKAQAEDGQVVAQHVIEIDRTTANGSGRYRARVEAIEKIGRELSESGFNARVQDGQWAGREDPPGRIDYKCSITVDW